MAQCHEEAPELVLKLAVSGRSIQIPQSFSTLASDNGNNESETDFETETEIECNVITAALALTAGSTITAIPAVFGS